MRRSFRTLRLCAIPGVSPRAGMQCPVGAPRTPHLLQRLPAPPRSGSGLGPERALEANNNLHRTQRESPILPRAYLRAQDRSRGAHNTPSGAGSVRSEPWRRTANILAQQRESPSSPEPPQRAQDRSRRAHNTPSGGTVTTTPRDGLEYAAFLQNAPVMRHTRGFTPGWYAVPRWGTPNASPSPEASCASRKRQRARAGASIGTSTS
jgi:hypothetical protein